MGLRITARTPAAASTRADDELIVTVKGLFRRTFGQMMTDACSILFSILFLVPSCSEMRRSVI